MKKSIITTLLVGLSCFGYTQVSLDSCRRWAHENYPLVQQYDLVAQSADYSVQNAARAWLPQVRLSAQATWQTDAARYPESMNAMLATMGMDLEGIRQDQYKIAIDVQQNIWDGGRSAAEKRIAQGQAEVDRLSANMDFYNLEGRVDDIYFGILLLEEQRSQTESRLRVLEDNLRRCQVMKQNGVLMQNEVDAVEAELLTAQQQEGQIASSCKAYRQMLSLLTGKDIGQATLVEPSVALTAEPPATHPQIEMLEALANQTEAQESMLRSASMPQLALFAQGWYGYPGLNMFENMQNADWSLNAIVGIKLVWNISAYYTQDINLARYRNRRHQIDVQREVVDFNHHLQHEQLNSEVERLAATLASDSRIVALRQSVRQSAEVKHAEGVMGTTELLRAITDESSAQSAQSLHRIELIKKQHEIKRL